MEKRKTGVIHGRFQILHNDHLKYLLAGKELCHHLYIGLTNPDPEWRMQESVDSHRGRALSNPLAYYERLKLVAASLARAGIRPDEFTVVPFPIHKPELIQYYVPLDAVFFLTIYDDWGREKLKRFQSLGLDTHILRDVPEEQKGISSSDIRERIIQGSPWKDMVPAPVYELLETMGIRERLLGILSGEDQ